MVLNVLTAFEADTMAAFDIHLLAVADEPTAVEAAAALSRDVVALLLATDWQIQEAFDTLSPHHLAADCAPGAKVHSMQIPSEGWGSPFPLPMCELRIWAEPGASGGRLEALLEQVQSMGRALAPHVAVFVHPHHGTQPGLTGAERSWLDHFREFDSKWLVGQGGVAGAPIPGLLRDVWSPRIVGSPTRLLEMLPAIRSLRIEQLGLDVVPFYYPGSPDLWHERLGSGPLGNFWPSS